MTINADPYYLVMLLTGSSYGELEIVHDVHPLGYAELCEEFSDKFYTPWYCETYGIIIENEIKLIGLDINNNFICEIVNNELAIISKDFFQNDNYFWEKITDSYAIRLGYLNGILEFKEEIEMDKLKSMLIHEPLLISHPFRDFGYFEKLSTIEQSKNDLNKMVNY